MKFKDVASFVPKEDPPRKIRDHNFG